MDSPKGTAVTDWEIETVAMDWERGTAATDWETGTAAAAMGLVRGTGRPCPLTEDSVRETRSSGP